MKHLDADNPDDLISLFAHDLKGPLGNIRSFADLAAQAGSLNEAQQKYMQRVDTNVTRALNILENLLLIQESGSATLHYEWVTLQSLIDETLELIEGQLLARQISVTVTISPEAHLLYCDPRWFGHVIYNLVSNAAKYNKPSGSVWIEAWRDDHMTVLRVTDDGAGIPQNALERIFDKFYRAKGSTKDGSGLGLSIVRDVVTRHGGSVSVDSAIGQRTRFTVQLPASPHENPLYDRSGEQLDGIDDDTQESSDYSDDSDMPQHDRRRK